ncbi:MAG: hypothetical protein LBD58_12730, partial [Treponema sp.]|nr:hypothetical protein [Treponema sp.]
MTDIPFGSGIINDIIYGAGKFVAVGESGMMAFSTDGIRWDAISSADSTFGDSDIINDVTYGGGKFIGFGEDYDYPYASRIAYSTDGVTWTAVEDSVFGDDSYIYGVTYGAGKFVAVGRDADFSG